MIYHSKLAKEKHYDEREFHSKITDAPTCHLCTVYVLTVNVTLKSVALKNHESTRDFEERKFVNVIRYFFRVIASQVKRIMTWTRCDGRIVTRFDDVCKLSALKR